MSESLMVALVNKGVQRQEAHRLLQQLVFQSQQSGTRFRDVLVNDVRVSKYLTGSEIELALDPKSYLGMSGVLSDAAVQKTVAERQSRGL